MKRLVLLAVFLTLSTSTFSQKKSELFMQLDILKRQIRFLEQEIAETKREVSSSSAKAETLEVENTGLREANASLLRNLGSFSELSKKNSENVNKTLTALDRMEKQISKVNAMLAANDSMAIVSLPQIKQRLGASTKTEVTEGTIVLLNNLTNLFGSDTSAELVGSGKAWLSNVAKIILEHPAFTTQVQGLNITGNFGPTFDQATAIAKELADAMNIPVEDLGITVKDGNFKEGIRISLQPDYKGFYNKIKESLRAKPQ